MSDELVNGEYLGLCKIRLFWGGYHGLLLEQVGYKSRDMKRVGDCVTCLMHDIMTFCEETVSVCESVVVLCAIYL